MKQVFSAIYRLPYWISAKGAGLGMPTRGKGKVVIWPVGHRPKSWFARLRGRATVKMSTEDILKLTRAG
jgi:hypothetical protein